MPGKKITKNQKRDYMSYRKNGNSQKLAASKVDISESSARRIENKINAPQSKSRHWQTRKNPFSEVWDSFILPILKESPTVDASFILEQLQEKYVGEYPDSKLRTLQRHVKKWKAIHGEDKPVIFNQEHYPGIQSISDFTDLKDIKITIEGKEFKHILYHFRLAYSGWSYMKVIQGGESFSALSEGLQEALWRLGGSPKEHRTDSLSAAFKNLSPQAADDLTSRYKEFCAHYSMLPTRNNKGVSHENGSIESPHGHLKRRIRQSLAIRGSNDFESIDEYEKWLDSVVCAHNKRNAKKFKFERPYLQDLPAYKTTDFEEHVVCVTSSSTFKLKRVTYSVPSRLIGERLRVLVYQRYIECYLGSIKVFESKRVIPVGKNRCRLINYKHIINALVKKPQAFRHSQIRDDILPSEDYKKIWKHVDQIMDAKSACKFIVGIMYLAYKYDCEKALANDVISIINAKRPLSLALIEKKYRPMANTKLPEISVSQHDISSYKSFNGEA